MNNNNHSFKSLSGFYLRLEFSIVSLIVLTVSLLIIPTHLEYLNHLFVVFVSCILIVMVSIAIAFLIHCLKELKSINQVMINQMTSKGIEPRIVTEEASLSDALTLIFLLKEKVQSASAMEQYLKQQAELQFLHGQINPHFLYNTLESIRSLALINNDTDAAKMAESLGVMFRSVLKNSGKKISLRAELNILDKYLQIQLIRFGNRFEYIKQFDETTSELDNNLVPSLILQPIVENSINHGIKNKSSGGQIILSIRYTDQRVIIKISDNGQGMPLQQVDFYNDFINDNEVIQSPPLSQKEHIGIGLSNINLRIRKEFGSDYGLVLRSVYGSGTEVEITLPKSQRTNYES